MYTVDYLKTLHADYVEWNSDRFKSKIPPASCFASMTMGFMGK